MSPDYCWKDDAWKIIHWWILFIFFWNSSFCINHCGEDTCLSCISNYIQLKSAILSPMLPDKRYSMNSAIGSAIEEAFGKGGTGLLRYKLSLSKGPQVRKRGYYHLIFIFSLPTPSLPSFIATCLMRGREGRPCAPCALCSYYATCLESRYSRHSQSAYSWVRRYHRHVFRQDTFPGTVRVKNGCCMLITLHCVAFHQHQMIFHEFSHIVSSFITESNLHY